MVDGRSRSIGDFVCIRTGGLDRPWTNKMEVRMKRSIRTVVFTLAAVLSLVAAGYAATADHVFPGHGKPSVTPPPWSHGDNGKGHGNGQDNGKGHGSDGLHGHGDGQSHGTGH
jgi:hypothetical protein